MRRNKIKFKLNDKLNAEDTIDQTFGCRHSNPDICGNCYVENICAFTSDDCICKRPPVSWKKRILLEKDVDELELSNKKELEKC